MQAQIWRKGNFIHLVDLSATLYLPTVFIPFSIIAENQNNPNSLHEFLCCWTVPQDLLRWLNNEN